MEKGYIHVYTGNGKGKTTSAIGLGIRAVGAGLKVHMVQFMKGRKYCELNTIDTVNNFTYSQHGRDVFVNKNNPEKIDIDMAQEGFRHVKKLINSNKYDMIILDEINVAVDFKLINLEDVLRVMQDKPKKLELVLTGRYANSKIVESADYVTEMLEIIHPYKKGVQARKGFDF